MQAVREAVDILEIAGAHAKLQKVGRKWKALCPFHKEKTPSFQLDPDQGLYYCFGCGKGGDAIKLHMELTGDDFPAAGQAAQEQDHVRMSRITWPCTSVRRRWRPL